MPSPQLLIAPAAGGKTAYAIHLALQMARRQQTQVRVCVPTSLQARAWRSRLAAAGGAIGIHILTFDQLAAACLNEARETYTQLSNPVEYRLLRTVIDRQELRHYAPLKTKPGFVQVTQQLIAELKSARVMLVDFATAVTQSGGEARLTELADLYTAYQTELQNEGWADRVGLHWLAAEALAERAPNACRNWPLLIVDGFDDFTPAQLTLLQLLANRAENCIVTLTQAERLTFPRHEATKAAVEAALGITARPLPEMSPQPMRHPTLSHLSRHIFAMPPGAVSPHAGAVVLREAPDRFAEARAALRWLKQQIVWHAIAPDQVALLARDMSAYRPFVQQIAAEFGLPIRLEDGQPLAQSPAIAALLSLLRLHVPIDESGEANLPRRAVIAAWRSPYFFWQIGEESITAADADGLDALARQQRVIRGRAQWAAAFAAALTAAEATNFPDDEEEQNQRPSPTAIVRSLHAKFAHFLAITQPPNTAATMREFVRWLEALIGPDSDTLPDLDASDPSLRITAQARRSPATAVADIAALRTLKDILRGLVWAEEAVEQRRPITFADFYAELSGAITAAHFKLPPRADQPEILVADAIQARGLSFQAVALMGLSEGSFPATLSEDPFLRDADRHTLRARFGFPLKSTTQSAEREFFYEAITRAREKLLLTRPVLADNGAEWVASPYWEAVRRLVDAEPLPIASEAIVPLAETASWAEWWETAVSLPDGASLVQPQDTAVWQHIQAAAHIWHARQQAATSQHDGDLSVLAAELADRFGPDHLWSASRLEAYKTCGFLFFLQAVMKLEPRQEPVEGLDVRQLGLVYHEIFEQTAALWPKDARSDDDEALRALVTAVATPILDAAPDKQGFRETPWWSQTRQEIIDNVTRSLQLLAQGEYAFAQAEAAFGSDSPPLVLRDGADRLRLRGFIDRIDRRADGRIRIIDYKSGGKTAFSPRAFAEGKKLQLPLYARAAQDTLGLGEVADGFYWHFQQAEASPFQLAAGEGGVAAAMDTAVAHAWNAVRQIRNGRFAPTPPADGCPTYCPAAGFCWQYSPKQW